MSAVATPSLKRDLGLIAWQIRYEQRAYWRNRGRGVFTFVFPLMFLVIFASLNQGAHISTRGGIAYDAFFVPGILAYGVIATTFVNMAIRPGSVGRRTCTLYAIAPRASVRIVISPTITTVEPIRATT